MPVAWKQDEWGVTAVVDGWLTLTVNRPRKEGETGWAAFVAGMPVGGRAEAPTRFTDRDDAMHAAEKEARAKCLGVVSALSSGVGDVQ